MQIAGKFRCVTVVVTDPAIDEREVILFSPKVGASLVIENSGAPKVEYSRSSLKIVRAPRARGSSRVVKLKKISKPERYLDDFR